MSVAENSIWVADHKVVNVFMHLMQLVCKPSTFVTAIMSHNAHRTLGRATKKGRTLAGRYPVAARSVRRAQVPEVAMVYNTTTYE
jgi:hypothetical protein